MNNVTNAVDVLYLAPSDGANAIDIKITGEQIFKYLKGTSSPIKSSLLLTATLQNSTDYNWGRVINDVFEPLGFFDKTFNCNIEYMGGASSLIIRCYTADDTVYDDITISKLYDGEDGIDGADAYTAVLSNESHVVSCDSNGVEKSGELGNTGKAITKVLVYKGSALLEYGTNKDWTFGTMVDSNVTHGNTDDSVYVNTLTADSGYVDISIVIGATTITKRFSLVKSKDGANGSGAKSIKITGNQVYRYASGAVIPEVENIILTATLQNSTGYHWGKMVNGSFVAFDPAITTNQISLKYTALGTDNSLVIRCYTANDTVYDDITIVKVFDGVKGDAALVYNVSPSSLTIAKKSSGDFAPSSVDFNFFKISGTNISSYTGYFKTYYSSDGATYTEITRGNASNASVTPQVSHKLIKCELYTDSGYTNMVDSQTVTILEDGISGVDSVSIILSNEMQMLACSSNGTIKTGELSKATTKIQMYKGTSPLVFETDLLYTDITKVDNGGTFVIANDSISLSSFTGTNISAYCDISVKYLNKTYTKRFSVAKTMDGSSGESAVMYDITPSCLSLSKSYEGVFSPLTVNFIFHRTVGSTRYTFTGFYKTYYSDGDDLFIPIENGNAASVSVTPQLTYTLIKCELYSDSEYTNLVASQIITVVNDGEPGQPGGPGPQGKTGNKPYPAGAYDANTEYKCTASVAPYVLKGQVYFVMNKIGTSKGIDPANDYATNGDNATWIPFDMFKAIITEILVANFGKLASAVFSGDFMFSQQGTLNIPVFKWAYIAPGTPIGGTYFSPVPSGWSNTIPASTGGSLYYSIRKFNANGINQEAVWTSPVAMVDTSSIKFKFSSIESPTNPNDDLTGWSSTVIVGALWFAVSTYSGGVWSNYVVTKVLSTYGYENFEGSSNANDAFVPNYFVNFLTGNFRAISGVVGLLQMISGAMIGRDTSGIERIRFSSGPIDSLSALTNSWESISEGVLNDYSYMFVTNSYGIFTGYNDTAIAEKLFSLSSPGSIKLINPVFSYSFSPSNYIPSGIGSLKVSILDSNNNVVYEPTTNVTNAISLAAGTYKVRLTTDVHIAGEGDSSTRYMFQYSVGFDSIETQKASTRTMIGSNGFYSMFGINSYLYYRSDFGLQVRYGNYGFRILSDGIKYSNTMNNATPSWTALIS